ncbi:hypothetical protein LJK88_07515 [Paenibacillus sp. P26]|nr:hypothetical protein LJK88_07515 [Paenibacillus sp. P26]
MQTLINRWAGNTLAVLCLVMLILICTQKPLPDLSFLSSPNVQSFKTLFISIILEARLSCCSGCSSPRFCSNSYRSSGSAA